MRDPAGCDASTQACSTVGDLLVDATKRLQEAGIEHPRREAGWMLEAALGLSSLSLHVERDRVLTREQQAQADSLLARRARREPLQYVLGVQEFCGLEFEVSPAVLIPRPESEMLVEEMARAARGMSAVSLADIGTGSGCIAVSCARALPAATVYAVDLSEAALTVARRNAARHGVHERVRWFQGDLCGPLQKLGLKVDMVVSNPPYIREDEWAGLQPEVQHFEPRLALMGGSDGLEIHRRLIDQAWQVLVSGGLLVLEVGQGQAEIVCQLLQEIGRYGRPLVRQDPAGIARVVSVDILS